MLCAQSGEPWLGLQVMSAGLVVSPDVRAFGLAALSRINSTLFGLIVNCAAFSFADGNHRHNDSLINDLVHQPIACSLQLDFVTVRHAVQGIGADAR